MFASSDRRGDVLLFYALIFFLAAGVAALAGFNEIAPGIAGIARLISYGFLALALITLVLGIPRR